MRDFIRNCIHWSVRETGGAGESAPAARRCLIFDSESVVRRVWVYPESWAELSEDQLWELMCGVAHVVVPPIEPHALPSVPDRPAMLLAAETTAHAQALLAHISLLRESNQRLREENFALRASCLAQRNEMRSIVETFAARMRVEGVAPEQAIVRIKGAVQGAVGVAIAADDLDAETMLHDAVSWGIAAYYAA